MKRLPPFALLLLTAFLPVAACNPFGGQVAAIDDRDRSVLVSFSSYDHPGAPGYVWLPGIALGSDRVAVIYDTGTIAVPEEILVLWPDGSSSAAEVADEAPAYQLVVLHAPGGLHYPPLTELSPSPKQGDEVTVRAYTFPWYHSVLTQQPRLDTQVRTRIPPFAESPATVVSAGAPMPPPLAKDEAALFLALKMDDPVAGKPYVGAGAMVLRDDVLVGIVSVSSNLGDVWAVPSALLRGEKASPETSIFPKEKPAMGEKQYARTTRQGPLEMTLCRTYQSISSFTVQLRLRNHSARPVVVARTEDLSLQRREQHSPVFLVTDQGTRLAPIAYGYERPTETPAGENPPQRTGFPPTWIIGPNREMVVHFTFPTSRSNEDRTVFRWTGIAAEGDETRYDFEFALDR